MKLLPCVFGLDVLACAVMGQSDPPLNSSRSIYDRKVDVGNPYYKGSAFASGFNTGAYYFWPFCGVRTLRREFESKIRLKRVIGFATCKVNEPEYAIPTGERQYMTHTLEWERKNLEVEWSMECEENKVLFSISFAEKKWTLGCQQWEKTKLANCRWTDYINEYYQDELAWKSCPDGMILDGFGTIETFDIYRLFKDQRYKFKCCELLVDPAAPTPETSYLRGGMSDETA